MTFPAGAISASNIRSQLYNNPNDAESTAYGSGPISWSDLYGESNYIKDYGTACNSSIPTSGTIGLSHLQSKVPLHNVMATGSNSALDSTGIHSTNVRSNHMTRTTVSGAYNSGASTTSASNKPHVVSMTTGTIHGTDQTGESARGTTGATGGVGFTANNPAVLSNNMGNKILGGGGQGGGGGNRGNAGYGTPGTSGSGGAQGNLYPGCGGITSNHNWFCCIAGNYLYSRRWDNTNMGIICGPGQTYRNGNPGGGGSGHTSGNSGSHGGYGTHGTPGNPGQSGGGGGSGTGGNVGAAGSAGSSGSPGNAATIINRGGTGYITCNNVGWYYQLTVTPRTNHFCGRSFSELTNTGQISSDTGHQQYWNKNNTANPGGAPNSGSAGSLYAPNSGGSGGSGGAAGAQYSGNVSVNTF